MSTIRERHADCREGQCMVTCDPADGRPIGCDTVVVLAELDKAEAASMDDAAAIQELGRDLAAAEDARDKAEAALAEMTERCGKAQEEWVDAHVERDAARADADALAEALDLQMRGVLSDDVARAALAAHKEATNGQP